MTTYNDKIICPYCQYEYSECLDYFEADVRDGSEIRLTCENCNKEMIVYLNIEYFFNTISD